MPPQTLDSDTAQVHLSPLCPILFIPPCPLVTRTQDFPPTPRNPHRVHNTHAQTIGTSHFIQGQLLLFCTRDMSQGLSVAVLHYNHFTLIIFALCFSLHHLSIYTQLTMCLLSLMCIFKFLNFIFSSTPFLF